VGTTGSRGTVPPCSLCGRLLEVGCREGVLSVLAELLEEPMAERTGEILKTFLDGENCTDNRGDGGFHSVRITSSVIEKRKEKAKSSDLCPLVSAQSPQKPLP
jgi:hypothetical protein